MDAKVALLGSNKHNLLDFVHDFLLRPDCDGDGLANQRYLELVGRRYQHVAFPVRPVSSVEDIQG